MSPAQEEYVERVLCLVEAVPPGRVTTYGAIAAVVGGGPRRVGTIMSLHGGGVPWWRVVRADGSLPPSHADRARECYREEGTPLRGERVEMVAAFFDAAEGSDHYWQGLGATTATPTSVDDATQFGLE